MWVLHHEPWLSAGELAERLGANDHATRVTMRRLMKRGLIVRENDVRAVRRSDGAIQMCHFHIFAIAPAK